MLDSSGSPSSRSSACTTGWSGMRTPTVRFFGCGSRRGTSRVAGRMNVYGPGVAALMARNAALSSCTNWPSWAKSAHTSVKWCLSSSCRMPPDPVRRRLVAEPGSPARSRSRSGRRSARRRAASRRPGRCCAAAGRRGGRRSSGPR